MSHLKDFGCKFQPKSQRLRICKNQKEVFWDDFEKHSAIELLKRIHHKSFSSIYFAPCKRGLLIPELKLLWPEAQIDCLIKAEDKRGPLLDPGGNVRYLSGSLESAIPPKNYDLIFITEGFEALSHPKSALKQWHSHLNEGGILAFSSLIHLKETLLKPLYTIFESGEWKGGLESILDNIKHSALCSRKYILELLDGMLDECSSFEETQWYQLDHISGIKRMIGKVGLEPCIMRGISSNHDSLLRRLWTRYLELYMDNFYDPQSRMTNFPLARIYFEGVKGSVNPAAT